MKYGSNVHSADANIGLDWRSQTNDRFKTMTTERFRGTLPREGERSPLLKFMFKYFLFGFVREEIPVRGRSPQGGVYVIMPGYSHENGMGWFADLTDRRRPRAPGRRMPGARRGGGPARRWRPSWGPGDRPMEGCDFTEPFSTQPQGGVKFPAASIKHIARKISKKTSV